MRHLVNAVDELVAEHRVASALAVDRVSGERPRRSAAKVPEVVLAVGTLDHEWQACRSLDRAPSVPGLAEPLLRVEDAWNLLVRVLFLRAREWCPLALELASRALPLPDRGDVPHDLLLGCLQIVDQELGKYHSGPLQRHSTAGWQG
eukprot:COSAG06_NODE_6613_length_2855_cov_3.839985_1_plen_147_part_00